MSPTTDIDTATPPDDDAPLPWATWLRISARRLKREPDERAAILAAEEIDPSRWNLADHYWNLLIAERLAEGDFTLSEQVASACVRELAARRQASSATASSTPERTGVAAAPSVAVAPGRTPLDLGTAIGAIPGVPALPFAPAAPGESAIERAARQASEARPGPRPPRSIGETEAVDVGALARRVLAFGPPDPAPPTRAQAVIRTAPHRTSPAAPALTVEQYASLCVDLELSQQGATAVLERYGVTPDGRRTLDDAWKRIFAEQPERRAAFEHARATYLAWLSRGAR